uniref:Uncharacterized protein n=1 Tax=Plectus sambesii TaxID=2011161 RepID=A0A914UI46_9BILA
MFSNEEVKRYLAGKAELVSRFSDNAQRLSYLPGTRRMTALLRQNPHLFTYLFLTESVPSPSFTNRRPQSRCLPHDAAYILGGHPEKFTPTTVFFLRPPSATSTMSALAAFSFLLLFALSMGREPLLPPGGPPPLVMTSLPQCRCSAIDECTKETQNKINVCKAEPTCEKFLKEIGDAVKIRACLDKEHEEMLKMELCVKEKVGELGCTTEENPKNLTVPVIPLGVGLPPPPPAS